MKTLLLASLIILAAARPAQAERFECGFTEPFYTITYDTGTQVLTRRDDVMEKTTKFRHVSFEIVGRGDFRILNQRGTELMRLKLTGKGSDGMSPVIYPYEASTNLLGGANNGVGGCASSLLKNRMGEP